MRNLAVPILLGIFLLLVFTVVRASVFEMVEEEKHIYFEIVFLLLLAVAGELAVVYFRQPSVMILMLIGIIMSPSFTDLAWENIHKLPLPLELPENAPHILRMDEMIHVFAQLGAVILLFKVGLHNRLEKIFAFDNMIVAVLGIIVPFLSGFLYASMSGGSFAYSMFLGAALTATSVGITVAVLKELNLLQERFAQIIIGAAVIDDVLSLLVLSFVLNITGGNDSIIPIIYTFVVAIVFIAGAVIAGRYFLGYMDRKEMSSRRFLMALAFMLFYAYVAEFIRLSAIVGAFLAGIILNQSRHIKEIEEKTYGLELLFMPIFFISLGILFDVNALAQYILPIILISVIAVFSKIVPCGLGALIAKLSSKEALLTGVGMVPRGEVALIVGSIGLTAGVLSAAEYSVISSVALITTLIVPSIITHIAKSRRA